MGIDEKTAGRLEQSGARALALLGNPVLRNTAATQGGQESSQENARGPDAADAGLIAARIRATSGLESDAATAIANDIVDKAVRALLRLAQDQRTDNIDETEALALESVMLVRGRPALRVFDTYLESLGNHPGSEFWQEFIAEYEQHIVDSAAATGAAVVRSFTSGNPPWVQGSAWLVAPTASLPTGTSCCQTSPKRGWLNRTPILHACVFAATIPSRLSSLRTIARRVKRSRAA